MLQFNDPRGFDPFTTKCFGSGDEQQFSDRYFSAFPVNWQAQSSAHALLLNEAGRLVYFGAGMEYALNAYTKTYFGASIEYILGGIVLASFDSQISFSSLIAGSAIKAAAFNSQITLSSAISAQRIVEASFASALTLSSAFLPSATHNARFDSTLLLYGDFTPDKEDGEAFVFEAGGFGVSRFRNYAFNSFAELAGHYYGANNAGLFDLEGDGDAGDPIEAILLLPRLDLGTEYLKRLVRVYLHGVSLDNVRVRVVDDQGVPWEIESGEALGRVVNVARIVAPLGLSENYVQIEIRNKNGGPLRIDKVGLLADILSRRIKAG